MKNRILLAVALTLMLSTTAGAADIPAPPLPVVRGPVVFIVHPSVKERITADFYNARAAVKSVPSKAVSAVKWSGHEIRSGAAAAGKKFLAGAKWVGHKIDQGNKKIQPAVGVANTILTMSGAWYFMRGNLH